MTSSQSCQRCGKSFSCLSDDIANCDCYTVTIKATTQQFLTTTNYNCLCNSCLSEIDALVEQAEKLPKLSDGALLIESLQYYIENGRWVFTELYHIQKGHCCGNGCRHCAYGYKKS